MTDGFRAFLPMLNGPGKTHKKQWDKMDRQIKSGTFPASLQPLLKRQKQDIFGLFLDFEGDWDKVECEAQRWSKTKNLARKDWTAVQAKTLKLQMDDDKFNALIKKREDAGLCYPDYDWPNDPMDRC